MISTTALQAKTSPLTTFLNRHHWLLRLLFCIFTAVSLPTLFSGIDFNARTVAFDEMMLSKFQKSVEWSEASVQSWRKSLEDDTSRGLPQSTINYTQKSLDWSKGIEAQELQILKDGKSRLEFDRWFYLGYFYMCFVVAAVIFFGIGLSGLRYFRNASGRTFVQ